MHIGNITEFQQISWPPTPPELDAIVLRKENFFRGLLHMKREQKRKQSLGWEIGKQIGEEGG